MADSNNQPEWIEHSAEGNGRTWQQNGLPKGARTAAGGSNEPKYELSKKGIEGNGFGNYDPRHKFNDIEPPPQTFMPEVKGEGEFSNHGGTRENPLTEEKQGNGFNPFRNKMDKRYTGEA